MTNEAVCIETPTKFARYTVPDGTAVAIGTLMKLSGANTACASTATSDAFAGMAWEEKTASDGITELTCAINGTWDVYLGANTTITNGAIVNLSGANLIRAAVEADTITGGNVGKILEPGVASTACRVRVGGW